MGSASREQEQEITAALPASRLYREEAEKVIANSAAIAEMFAGLGFSYVTLDLEWLRSGSMDLKLISNRNR